MRSIAEPFVAGLPTGARVRTRLRPTIADEAVLRAVGAHLGRLAGDDLAWRCRLGRGDDQWAVRKRAATSESSSRWAGTITRTSNDQWQRGLANLTDQRVGLRRAIRAIRARLAAPVGRKRGEVNGCATRAERYEKQRRLQHLEAKLARVEDRLCSARVSVCRGGHKLAKLRHHLDRVDVALTRAEWQACWQAKRWFLTADGDATKRWGNETIRVNPEQQWLELRLPTTMAGLSNTSGPACTYRLACPVTFHHRRDEWAVQAASGSVRYDISYRPDRNRWYLDASWQTKAVRSLHLDALSASTREGRPRAAIAAILRLAQTKGCRSIVIEDLDFADARQTGRETLGRGRRARWFRKTVAGMPTRRFRTFLAGMAANADLWVIAVDPGWTSKWGRRYWQPPLHDQIVDRRHPPSRGGSGHRQTWPGRRGPATARCARSRPEDRGWRATGQAGPAAP